MKRFLGAALAVLAVLLVLAGCGGTKTVTSTTTAAAAPRTASVAAQPNPCPPHHSFAGCASPGQPSPGGRTFQFAPVAGPEFPDVSDWQGPITPNGSSAGVDWSKVKAWQQSHGWPAGGVFKIGEYGVDPDAAINNSHLKANGMWRAGYWFLRNTGCAHEAGQIINEAKTLGLGFVWLDAEVSEARGYTTCLIPAVRNAGLGVGIYTALGTWPGGASDGAPLWDAAYNFSGPSSGLFAPASCWQFSDGAFGSVTDVPGIGKDDVNVDLQGGACRKLAQGGTTSSTIMDTTVRTFNTASGTVKASEFGTWTTWVSRGCSNPVQRDVCKSSRFHGGLLRDRLYSVVQNFHHGSYAWDHARGRFYRLTEIQNATRRLG